MHSSAFCVHCFMFMFSSYVHCFLLHLIHKSRLRCKSPRLNRSKETSSLMMRMLSTSRPGKSRPQVSLPAEVVERRKRPPWRRYSVSRHRNCPASRRRRDRVSLVYASTCTAYRRGVAWLGWSQSLWRPSPLLTTILPVFSGASCGAPWPSRHHRAVDSSQNRRVIWWSRGWRCGRSAAFGGFYRLCKAYINAVSAGMKRITIIRFDLNENKFMTGPYNA